MGGCPSFESAFRRNCERNSAGQEEISDYGRTRPPLHTASYGKTDIKKAVAELAFFIPIITPTAVRSRYCKFEFETFLAREKELGRSNLVFPILYISVPALTGDRWREDPLLAIIGSRQYEQWQNLRHLDPSSTEVALRVEKLCENISKALRQQWLSPQERHEAEARRVAEDERRRQEKLEREAQRVAEEEHRRQEAEAKRRLEETEVEKRRQDNERRKRENEAAWAAKKARALHLLRGRMAAGAAAVALLLIGGGIWLHRTSTPTGVTSAEVQPDKQIAAGAISALSVPVKPSYGVATPEKLEGSGAATRTAPQELLGQSKRGEAITAKVCQPCHTFEKGGVNKLGANLWGVVGRPKFDSGFNYSAAMKAKGGDWTIPELNDFLANPLGYIPGTTMTFAGLPRPQERADVITYLNTLSDDPKPLPTEIANKPVQSAEGTKAQANAEATKPAGVTTVGVESNKQSAGNTKEDDAMQLANKIAQESEADQLKKRLLQQTLENVGKLRNETMRNAASNLVTLDDEAKIETTLGLKLASMSDDLRRRYNIKDTLDGVVITSVEANSSAAKQGLLPGYVISATYSDLKAEINKQQSQGRRFVILGFSRPDGRAGSATVSFPKNAP